MDFLNRIAKGIEAARAAIGSDEIAPPEVLVTGRDGVRLKVGPRRKKPDGPDFIRIESPIGDGWAQIDLPLADARRLGEMLIAQAEARAALAAKPVATLEPPAPDFPRKED